MSALIIDFTGRKGCHILEMCITNPHISIHAGGTQHAVLMQQIHTSLHTAQDIQRFTAGHKCLLADAAQQQQRFMEAIMLAASLILFQNASVFLLRQCVDAGNQRMAVRTQVE